MAYYSKYTGKELEERLDRINDIPTLIDKLFLNKEYLTELEVKCLIKEMIPLFYKDIPIDNKTIYWDNGVLKSVCTGEGNNEEEEEEDYQCLWELREHNGQQYIYSKLPVVTQYGITIYGDNGDVDLPSLYAGLPIDGQTIYWDNGVLKSLDGGGGLDEEALRNYLLINEYVTRDELPSLNGYATESWVLNLGYIGPEGLKNYVDISSNQDINGKKNFKSGISINGLDIYQSQDDVIYLDANLVVRGGITMYSINEADIPSIVDYIPTASTTTKGVASFDDSFFTVDSNGKVSLINSSGGIDETELEAYLTSNNYAKKSDIPSLVGYATESWVNTRIDSLINGAPAAYDTLKEIADVLQGNVNSIGDIITALGTKWTQDNTKIANWDTAYSWGNHANAGYALKSYVDSTFVTLGSTQTITGEKNFTGGIKVNGSPIYYDSTNKYWKLEGDLLVTGGVTMYGSDSEFTPSTIMDAIQTDGVTIRVNPTTKNLEVIGNTSGATTLGQLQNVGNWADSVADVDRIMYQAAGSSNWVSKNLSDLELKGDYLPLSGGELTGRLYFVNNSGNKKAQFGWASGAGSFIYNYASDKQIGITDDGTPYVFDGGIKEIYHKGNFTPSDYLLASTYTASDILSKLLTVDGSGSGLDADLLDGYHANSFFIKGKSNQYNHGFIFDDYTSVDNDPNAWNNEENVSFKLRSSNNALVISVSGKTNERKAIIQVGHQSTEYASALGSLYLNKLGGNVYIGTVKAATINDNVASATKLETPRTIWGQSFDGSGDVAGDIHIYTIGQNINENSPTLYFRRPESETAAKPSVGIKAIADGGYGRARLSILQTNATDYKTEPTEVFSVKPNGNVLIGTTTDSGYKLDVNGTIGLSGALTLTGTDSGTAAINFSRVSFNYILAPSGGSICIQPDGIGASSSKGYRFRGSRFEPSVSDTYNLGTSSTRWKGTYSVLGDFSGNVTFGKKAIINGIPIYKSQDDVLYIDGNLVVRGGITMYGTNTTSVPSILDSLPIASTTTKGIASFDSNFFSVGSDGKVTFIGQTGGGVADNVAWSNITGKPTTLSGYGITDAYTTSTIDTKLSRYLSLSGGELNSNSSKADVLILNSGTFQDSTGYHTTLNLYTNGELSSQFGYSSKYGVYMYLKGNIYLGIDVNNNQPFFGGLSTKHYTIYHSGNFTPSNYLSLSGGTIKTENLNGLTIKRSSSDYSVIRYMDNTELLGYIGMSSTSNTYSKQPVFIDSGINTYKIWHSGNDGSGSGLDADLLDGVHLSNIVRYADRNDNGTNAATAQTITYWGDGHTSHGYTYGTSLNLQGAGSWNHRLDFRTDGWLDYYQGINTNSMSYIGTIAFVSSNVASATKLQTARTIWGHGFDGTGNIGGDIKFSIDAANIFSEGGTQLATFSNSFLVLGYGNCPKGLSTYLDGYDIRFRSGYSWNTSMLIDGYGNVGIGFVQPSHKLEVNGNGYFVTNLTIGETYIASGAIGFNRNTEAGGRFNNSYNGWQFHVDRSDNRLWIYTEGTNSGLKGCWDTSGNYLVYGGITMYSDKRKKTILNHVELSLKDIANAPLIEHYYNSDDLKTTHVGSIAQYWASMNDWFCKLDSEGFYTMEIQNCALASAISIARELDRYESKTDKTIKQLKKRICQLEEEVERLRAS